MKLCLYNALSLLLVLFYERAIVSFGHHIVGLYHCKVFEHHASHHRSCGLDIPTYTFTNIEFPFPCKNIVKVLNISKG